MNLSQSESEVASGSQYAVNSSSAHYTLVFGPERDNSGDEERGILLF